MRGGEDMVMCNVTQVDFYNPDKEHVYKGLLNDETEFDTHSEQELAELWWDFCKENGLIEVYKTKKRGEYPSPIGQGDGCSGGKE